MTTDADGWIKHDGKGMPVDGGGQYLVWSNEHGAWWRANFSGYATSILSAGIYSREDAVRISHKGRDGWHANVMPSEIPVAIADIPSNLRDSMLAQRDKK